jgi:hypothetical protein
MTAVICKQQNYKKLCGSNTCPVLSLQTHHVVILYNILDRYSYKLCQTEAGV